MSLFALCRDARLDLHGLEFGRLGPRKSAQQAQTWLILKSSIPTWVIKFCDRSSSPKGLRNEIRFLEAATDVGPILKSRLPEIVAGGHWGSIDYLITKFVDQPPSHAWFSRKFLKSPGSLKQWFCETSEFLEVLQGDTLLRCQLSVPEGSYLQHGDFHFMNILGASTPEIIIDWEDWSAERVRYRDMMLCLVLPTLIPEQPDLRRKSFQRHWVTGSAWSNSVRPLLDSFLDGVTFHQALYDTMTQQADRLMEHTPNLGHEFQVFASDVADRARVEER